MISLILISSVIAYLTIGGFVFGYTRSIWGVCNNGWESPGPFFAGVCWPFLFVYVLCTYFPNKLGYWTAETLENRRAEKLKQQAKIRLELEQEENRRRLELEKAEKELEQAEKELEEQWAYDNHRKKSMRKD